ncbi:hypothetical protein GCM10019016_083670 [Streptomyces prasinosporus]|uniref:Band 7 domain-containing protein n=1 Tax=Streptomyces prasinosporus TaxID=68256 RepID=A0ABP6U2Q3_9ACTN
MEQLTVTTLRNVVGSMDLEKTLTSRDTINSQLRGVLDEATGKWGLRVNRVEIKAIDPPQSIKEAMQKQMRAERDKRAAILGAEGQRQSQILTAEGDKQAAVLRAEGNRTAAILEAEGQSRAIDEVFQAIHRNDPDPKLLAYQYLQALPQLAQGQGNNFWVIPSEITTALQGVSKAFSESLPPSPATRAKPTADDAAAAKAADDTAEAAQAAAEAVADAAEADRRPRGALRFTSWPGRRPTTRRHVRHDGREGRHVRHGPRGRPEGRGRQVTAGGIPARPVSRPPPRTPCTPRSSNRTKVISSTAVSVARTVSTAMRAASSSGHR